ncbi:MAG TPA: TraR/DksA family transcriptional regulator [Aquabacterium sp.]|uniref:TraR/DksA family transcriptional regulator n=1 Tax=Aquabacterium sp. TaxID=1872578 RepID=UPI002E2EDA92|nr:TraR/DksA family transcriptional regulator [Aquabacterium sp.]HEX5372234.1 TraR/DksA family transcriptional regulator [Aquabacterium sp.]
MSVNTVAGQPEHLTPAHLEALRQRMQAQVDELVARDAALRTQLSSEASATANNFLAGAEGALNNESDEEAVALLHHEQGELAALNDALARMRSGHYGWCGACGEAISAARLDAVPEARLCIQCQDASEHLRPG